MMSSSVICTGAVSSCVLLLASVLACLAERVSALASRVVGCEDRGASGQDPTQVRMLLCGLRLCATDWRLPLETEHF